MKASVKEAYFDLELDTGVDGEGCGRRGWTGAEDGGAWL